MAYEVEIKVYLKNKERTLELLTQKGCVWEKEERQCDQIYFRPDLQKKGKNIFLRIRQENQKFILNLKQILNSLEVIEFESAVESPEEIEKMVRILEFEEYALVKKVRKTGSLGGITICLDEVEHLGSFLEVERLRDTEEERTETVQELKKVLASLEIGEEEICKERYHTMIHNL